ncbi:2-carboxy-D-arabinitol-1-phosphatase-like [Phalaenopsis equestris]|uniref:2-carboxy-D-arabinitol-1-phosphatase-like n=1 Tax=Phalaenopsis equestris TaxID=78828 RepID=UPI0009E2025E|nr:2-carboxy-D-arabinitol-1-phosphatase-like [Phalaenopsis equestris]
MLSVLSPLSSESLPLYRRNHRTLLVSCSSVSEVEKPPADLDPRPGLRRAARFPEIGEAKRVVLVRHGQSTWNEEGRIQGSSDHSVLTTKGELQAETSRQMLLGDSFEVCFTSPLIRSKRTAKIIWDSRKDKVLEEPDLREIDLYSFQGLLKHEGKEKFGGAYRQWQQDAANFQIDGHYPVRELWDRAESCWNKILAHEGRSVLVVAHNAVNQALVATAIGLGPKYFRILLQSNCGVSVLDFAPRMGGESPHIRLNRLNQTPNSPVTFGSSAGRKTNARLILVCHGATQSNEAAYSDFVYEPLNMLGIIQSQKTAELLLDLKVNCLVCSPRIASADTATAIREVQEAADCLGADCVPRFVEVKKMLELEVESILQRAHKISRKAASFQPGCIVDLNDTSMLELWTQSKKAWHSLLQQLFFESESESESERNVVAIAHPAAHIALITQSLKLTAEWMDSFHLDAGSISIIDFPDGPEGKGVIRCLNYTAHLGRWSVPVTRSLGNDEEF